MWHDCLGTLPGSRTVLHCCRVTLRHLATGRGVGVLGFWAVLAASGRGVGLLRGGGGLFRGGGGRGGRGGGGRFGGGGGRGLGGGGGGGGGGGDCCRAGAVEGVAVPEGDWDTTAPVAGRH